MKKFLAFFLAITLALSVFVTPALAEKKDNTKDKSSGVETSILNTCGQESDGTGCILRLIVDIMSIGIGILGVIGITIVGIQYLTASGDAAKVKKAKQRMFEIVIGLVAYVVIYAILRWLLPGFQGV